MMANMQPEFQYLLDAIIFLDEELNIVKFNNVFSNLLEISPKRIKQGRPINEFIQFTDFDLEKEVHLFKTTNEIPSRYKESPFVTKKDKKGLVLMSIKPLAEKDLFILILRDMSLEATLQDKYHNKIKELEFHNENLEKIVQDRTIKLQRTYDSLSLMIDSINQGLFSFNFEGDCIGEFTKVCDEMYHCSPENNTVFDVFNLQGDRRENLRKVIKFVFDGRLSVHDFAAFGFSIFTKENERNETKYIKVDYHPVTRNGQVNAIAVVGTDITEVVFSEREAEKERFQSQMLIAIINDKQAFTTFLAEISTLINKIERISTSTTIQKEEIDAIEFYIHTLKGMSGVFKWFLIQEACQTFENQIRSDEEINIKHALEDFITKISEAKNKHKETVLRTIGEDYLSMEKTKNIPEKNLRNFLDHQIHFKGLKYRFKENFLYEGCAKRLKTFEDIIKDVSLQYDKKVKFVNLTPDSSLFDFDDIEQLWQSLIHILKNCVFHGIELPDERIDKGKPEEGLIEFKMEVDQKQRLQFLISDDGRGLSYEKLKEKYQERTGESCDDKEILNKEIFLHGMSTNENRDINAGAGVGMGAVLEEVVKLGGEIKIESNENQGTLFKINIPYDAKIRSHQEYQEHPNVRWERIEDNKEPSTDKICQFAKDKENFGFSFISNDSDHEIANSITSIWNNEKNLQPKLQTTITNFEVYDSLVTYVKSSFQAENQYSNFEKQIEVTLKELLYNAFFNAPTDLSGSHLFKEKHLSNKSQLKSEFPVMVSTGEEDAFYWLRVEDFYGSLKREDFLKFVFNTKPTQKDGGAGLGFSIIFKFCHHLLIQISEKKSTKVTVIFTKNKRNKIGLQTARGLYFKTF
jgi:signal transduction histidine kinase